MVLGTCLSTILHEDRHGINWKRVFEEGETLDQIEELDEKTISNDIVNGVKYLHSKGILHNDIKVENIVLVDENGTRVAKLIDFGFADMFAKTLHWRERYIGTQTVTCRSPEFLLKTCKGDNIYSSDIWAVGIVLLSIETKVKPFENLTTIVADFTLRVLENIRVVLDTGLVVVKNIESRKRILGMLQYNPDNRILE